METTPRPRAALNLVTVTAVPLASPVRTGRDRRMDIAVAAVTAVIQVVGMTLAAHHQSGHGSIGVGGYVLLLAGPLALLWRRRHPVAVLWITFATTLAYWSLDTPRGPAHASLVV